jgi:hypothetical protein
VTTHQIIGLVLAILLAPLWVSACLALLWVLGFILFAPWLCALSGRFAWADRALEKYVSYGPRD